MRALRRFLRTTLLGGVVVLLPIGICLVAFAWVFAFIRRLISPVTRPIVAAYPDLGEGVAAAIVLAILIGLCFAVGLIIRTQVGRFVHTQLENRLLRIAPGYNMIKETVMQFTGNRPSPFSSVALVSIDGSDTLVTAFVTEHHDNGWYSVFVPSGPNPTSGNIFHVKPDWVHPVSLPVEEVMRSIISCGAGSASLLRLHEQGRGPLPGARTSA